MDKTLSGLSPAPLLCECCGDTPINNKTTRILKLANQITDSAVDLEMLLDFSPADWPAVSRRVAALLERVTRINSYICGYLVAVPPGPCSQQAGCDCVPDDLG